MNLESAEDMFELVESAPHVPEVLVQPATIPTAVDRLASSAITPPPPDVASVTAATTTKLAATGEALLLALVIFVALRWVLNAYRKSTGQQTV